MMGSTGSRLEERFQKVEKRIEGLEETIEVLSDLDTMTDIKEALDDSKRGRVKVYKDIGSYMNEMGAHS